MKRRLNLLLCAALMLTLAAGAAAQNETNADQGTDDLRVRLIDAQAKEAELQARVRQLDEDLKPENIERALAGVGSPKPEELRALRRRQLEIERDGVRAQLKIVTISRERLETVVRSLDAEAYQRSAEGPATLSGQVLRSRQGASSPWLIAGVVSVLAILGVMSAMVGRRPRIM